MSILVNPPTPTGQAGAPVQPPAEHLLLTLNNQEVSVLPGTTIWEAARQAGLDIPVLCHDPGMDPVAVCRVCAGEVQGSVRVGFPALGRFGEAGG